MSTTEKKSGYSEQFKTSIAITLGSEEWWKTNTAAVKRMLPDTWTHIHNLDGLKLGFAMKLLGIDWRDQNEFGRVMVFFEKIGIMQRQAMYQVRVNPNWELNNEVKEALG